MVNKQEVGPDTIEAAEAMRAALGGEPHPEEYPNGNPVTDADGNVLYPDGSVVVDPYPALVAAVDRRDRPDYITRHVVMPDAATARNHPQVDLSS